MCVDPNRLHERLHTQRQMRAGPRHQHRRPRQGQHQGLCIEHHGPRHCHARHHQRRQDQDVAGNYNELASNYSESTCLSGLILTLTIAYKSIILAWLAYI